VKKLWLVLVFVLTLGSASADELAPIQRAQLAVLHGQYSFAIELAAQSPEFALLMVDAEARLSRVSIGASTSPTQDIDQAEASAKQALALQPDALAPRISLITALGYRARGRSLFTGFRKGWAAKSRALIDEALVLAPDDPWPHALSGSWHLEILRRSGIRRAKFVGASFEAGLAGCATALKLANDDAKIIGQCALALLAVKEPILDEKGWEALKLASASTNTEDAFSCLRQDQALQILTERDSNGVASARELAVMFLLGTNPPTDWPKQCVQSRPLRPAATSGPGIQD